MNPEILTVKCEIILVRSIYDLTKTVSVFCFFIVSVHACMAFFYMMRQASIKVRRKQRHGEHLLRLKEMQAN
jgi:hypothetical protein